MVAGEYFRLRSDHSGVTLPKDWVIPETIQKCAYRNPWMIATRDLIKPPSIRKPHNNLDPNLEERKILRVMCVANLLERSLTRDKIPPFQVSRSILSFIAPAIRNTLIQLELRERESCLHRVF